MSGGATRGVELTNPDVPARRRPGPTFAGRDIFAPAAAHLANGVPITELGPEIDPYGLLPGLIPLSRDRGRRRRRRGAVGRPVRQLPAQRRPRRAGGIGDTVVGPAHWATTTCAGPGGCRLFGELGHGQVGLLVDSYGLVAIVVDRVVGRRAAPPPRRRRGPSSLENPRRGRPSRGAPATTVSPSACCCWSSSRQRPSSC